MPDRSMELKEKHSDLRILFPVPTLPKTLLSLYSADLSSCLFGKFLIVLQTHVNEECRHLDSLYHTINTASSMLPLCLVPLPLPALRPLTQAQLPALHCEFLQSRKRAYSLPYP